MKLHYSTTSIAIAASALPAFANCYNVAGPMFGAGRPILVTGRCGPGRCDPSPSSFRQQRRDWVDNAFEELESELNSGCGFPGNSAQRRRSSRRRGSGRVDFESDKEDEAAREKRMEAFRQQQKEQQEMFKKALDLANDVVTGLSSDDSNDSDSLKQQKQWLNRAFGIASDVASGRTSPRYEVNNSDDKFQISIDIPGVKISDIDIRVVDDEERGGNSNAKTLVVQGKRESSLGGSGDQKPVEFKKEFSFDASIIDMDTIAAEHSNGVLFVTASKIPKKEPAEKKIQVIEVADNEESVSEEDQAGAVDVEDTTTKTVELKSSDDEASEDDDKETKEAIEDEKP